ncbi:hypothetical protein [Virgibacillus halodenitrificans]|jgi:flagellin-like hook-associated protein FlgL|uniref:Uncharacterized protein n=1 Tax=Virgibacillus halodenitrificans TaxID=1482 RepID=A0AAC9J1Y1_VIRHA|nr:hypothetical protein [Virgibacillus halodenitrificans]APC49189.1 hypothetical protein BME96_13715 [Virgibacillus halodenitrificans]MCJ0932888.1 hypothetical protein [Virgibacillus halodenitrificans]
MSLDKENEKKRLELQMKWCEQKDYLLEKINEKLEEMKSIAVYAVEEELSASERQELNEQLNYLKVEVDMLQSQMQPTIH